MRLALKCSIALAMLFALFLPQSQAQEVIYVKKDAQGNNNGTDWENAFIDLQNAISNFQNGDEIWVARGTYFPTSGLDRNISFTMIPNIRIYGGFKGDEFSRFDRNLSEFLTILSGNIGSLTSSSDNSLRVINTPSNAKNTLLDGLIIRDGFGYSGAGVYVDNTEVNFNHLKFINNFSTHDGGAVYYNYVGNKEIHFKNLLFSSNNSLGSGGAIYIENGEIKFEACVFENNTAAHSGGAVFFRGDSLSIESSQFTSNASFNNDGGALSTELNSKLLISNSIFEKNVSNQNGGAINISGNTTLLSTQFSENVTKISGGAIFGNVQGIIDTMINCQILNNTAGTRGGGASFSSENGYFNKNSIIGNTLLYKSISGTTYYSGGVFMTANNTIIKNTIFSNNNIIHVPDYPFVYRAKAAGLYLHGDNNQIDQCYFIGNHNYHGIEGAINVTNTTITNTLFSGNSSIPYASVGTFYESSLDHCTIIGNKSSSGSAIQFINTSNTSAYIRNNIFSKNISSRTIAGYAKYGTNIMDFPFSGGTVIKEDPLLWDIDGPDNIQGTLDDNAEIGSFLSPAINKSDTTTGRIEKDILNLSRDNYPDLGAYEFPYNHDVTSTDTAFSYQIPDSAFACGRNFFYLPVISDHMVNKALGFDFAVYYDSSKVSPTGNAIINSRNINKNHIEFSMKHYPNKQKLNFSIYFTSQAPAGAIWNGIGEIIRIEFENIGAQMEDTLKFIVPHVRESYIGQTKKVAGDTTYISLFPDLTDLAGALRFWNPALNTPLSYDIENPDAFLSTTIIGVNEQGNQLTDTLSIDENGNFKMALNQATHLYFNRNIRGSFHEVYTPKELIQFINGHDAYLTKLVTLDDTTFIPSPEQLLAMDVNLDGAVSAGDISQMNQRSVGRLPEYLQSWNYDGFFPKDSLESKDWVFIDSTKKENENWKISENYPEPDEKNGFHKDNLPVLQDFINLDQLSVFSCSSVSENTYFGILLGDVDGNFDLNLSGGQMGQKGPGDEVKLDFTTTIENKNCVIQVPYYILSHDSVYSTDFILESLSSDLEFLGIEVLDQNIQFETNKIGNSYLFSSHSTSTYNIDEPILFANFRIKKPNAELKKSIRFKAMVNGNEALHYINGSPICGMVGTKNLIKKELNVFPNPSSGVFQVEIPSLESLEIKIISTTGKKLFSETVIGKQIHLIDLREFSNGVYFIEITDKQSIYRSQLIKQ